MRTSPRRPHNRRAWPEPYRTNLADLQALIVAAEAAGLTGEVARFLAVKQAYALHAAACLAGRVSPVVPRTSTTPPTFPGDGGNIRRPQGVRP
jgi:hypothetical protein